jgi:hypothetical protein
MSSRKHLLLAAVALAVGPLTAACSDSASDGEGEANALTDSAKFDKNNVLSNEALMDSTHITHAEVQRFLEKTPWGKRSALADYETPEGKRASVVMQEAAETFGINPLELLVRAQMEQRLVSRTLAEVRADMKKAAGDGTTDEEVTDPIDIAFGCGCPHAPVCQTQREKYTGFENQAQCAAKLIADDMKIALGGKALRNGWRRSKAMTTEDGVSITPANEATAILYSYTPYVGAKGGGNKSNVGGVYLHWDIWQSFAESLRYKAPGSNACSADGGGCEEEVDASASADAGAITREAGTRDSGGTVTNDGGACTLDRECGSSTSGRICDSTGKCAPGCRTATSGNRCPSGQACRLVDSAEDEGVCEPLATKDAGGSTRDSGSSSDDAGDDDAGTVSGGPPPEEDPGTAHEPPPQPPPPKKSSSSKKASSAPTELEDAGVPGGEKDKGGCSAAPVASNGTRAGFGVALALGIALAARRRKRSD